MISLVMLINAEGEILISRQYRDDVDVDAAAAFRIKVVAAKESGTKPPVVILDGKSYMYTRHNGIFLVAATSSNAHPAMIFHFLYCMRKVFQDYFGEKFTEEDVRDNFCLVYELFDEILDFGYPQIVQSDLLKKYINNGEVMTAEAAQKWTDEVTGAVDWRSNPGPTYAKNEVFIDVLEDVNLLMSANGTVLRNEVVGKVMMKTFLTGMPECKFGLNDKLTLSSKGAAAKKAHSVEMDDCTFHRCVKLGKFEADRSITFVPPDGEFELMRYRITDNVNLPFRVLPVIEEHGANHVEMNIQAHANFSDKLFASKVVFHIPAPPNTASCKLKATIGRAKWIRETNEIIWTGIRKFPGGAEHRLTASVTLISTMSKRKWSRPPIRAEFQVPMFTASGLHVRFLKVFEKTGYQTTKWVRYISRAAKPPRGSYSIRTSRDDQGDDQDGSGGGRRGGGGGGGRGGQRGGSGAAAKDTYR